MTTTALVAHESMFGRTAAIAAAVARGLGRSGIQVDVVDVASTDRLPHPASSYDVLVVGAPTHAFSLSRPASRAQAVEKGAPADRAARGLRDWFVRLSESSPGADHAAAFDTRTASMRHLPGSAAATAGRVLRRHGFKLLDRPASFYVTEVTGPLVDGELERAEEWGATLAASAQVARAKDLARGR